MGRAHDRYIVRELFGYPIGEAGTTGSDAPGETDVYVLDRWYCHAVVESYPARQSRDGAGRFGPTLDLGERRLQAQARANRLNEEHRSFLHAGRWADGRVS